MKARKPGKNRQAKPRARLKKIPPLEFFARFGLAFIASYSFLLFFSPLILEEAFTQIQHFLLSLAGITSTIQGNLLFLEKAAFIMTESCIGIVSTSMILGLVFAAPGVRVKNQPAIALLGITTMLLVNIARVFTVLLVGAAEGAAAAESVHVASWFVMALGTAGVWYYFVKKIEQPHDFRDIVKVPVR